MIRPTHPLTAFLRLLILLTLIGMACQLPQTPSGTPTALPVTLVATPATPTHIQSTQGFTSPTPRPTSPPQVPEHRIAIHTLYGIAEFYDRQTSQRFIPRGVNYFLLAPVLNQYENRVFGVGVYDHDRTRTDFQALYASGYNTVRIFLDGCTTGSGCVGLEDGQGLNPAYLDNIVDAMSLAKEAHLFLLLASNDLPDLGGYAALSAQGADDSFSPYRNSQFLTPAGISATKQYWSDLLGGLAARQAAFDIVLGWELLNEQFYLGDEPPFSLESGTVTPANEQTYDMADPAQKQALAVDGMRYYIAQLRQTILTYDPTALVTMGFFAPDSPNPWRQNDTRYVETAALLDDSALDFLDFHAYPGVGLSMAQLAQNFGLSEHVSTPVLMGEVGAFTWAYPSVEDGAIAVQDWIAGSCPEGFDGWLYWGYYPAPAGMGDATWGFVDARGYLMNALSPFNQPDACTTSILPGRNLALGKPVTVSAALPDQTPGMAVDGDFNNQWSAGAFPMQWIEIDLGAPSTIGEIRLTVGQWPSGSTVHQVWVGTSRDAMQQVYEFSDWTTDFDVLEYIPTAPLQDIQYVRIVTTESPSWVSWREIEVLVPFPPTPTPTPELSITPTP
jgi:F5/8 type C domain